MRLIFKLKVIENESEYQAALQRRLELHGFACRGMPQRDEEGLLELLIRTYEDSPAYIKEDNGQREILQKIGVWKDSTTVVPAVLSLFATVKCCEFTKREVVQLINQTADSLYWLHRGSTKGKEGEFLKNSSLRVNAGDVYLNREVDDLIVLRGGDCNLDFRYIDLDPPKGCPSLYCF